MKRIILRLIDCGLVATAIVSLGLPALRLTGHEQVAAKIVPWLKSTKHSPQVLRPTLHVGQKFEISDLPSGRVLVIARSKECPYCRANTEFHRRLVKAALRDRLAVVIVTPSKDDADETLEELDAKGTSVTVRRALAQAHLPGIPSVVFTNDGSITAAWVGFVASSIEPDVVRSMSPGDPATAGGQLSVAMAPAGLPRDPHTIGSTTALDLEKLPRDSFVLIDLRQRDEFRPRLAGFVKETRNIPADEIYGRYYELTARPGKRIIVDCGSVPAITCRNAAVRLQTSGLTDVTLLDEGVFVQPGCLKVE